MLAASPFVGVGVAQAAMAGGNPLTTTNRPDLRTVHVNTALQSAEFCFDKTLANQKSGGGALTAGDFYLGGYRYDTNVEATTANLESSNTNCISTNIGGSLDLQSYSFGSVADGAVISNAGGSAAPGNVGDSTANLDSNSHNGTVGHTTGPDLVASSPVDTTNNRIVFSFDQAVNTSTLASGAGKFLFYDANGTAHYGTPVGADSLGNVSVQFADSVTSARRIVAIRGNASSEGQPANQSGAVQEKGGTTNRTDNPVLSAVVPGTSGNTAAPDLVSAALVPGPSNQIDYTFDEPVSASTGDPSDFTAVRSNGGEESANAATVIAGNTVRATFSSSTLQNFQEEIVAASAYAGAVKSVNDPRPNTTGGVPVGDNAGAFSTGFSTGPDARSVTFDKTNGSVVIQMDQRVEPDSVTNPSGNFILLANDGSQIASTPLSASVVNNAPFQSQIRLTYNPSEVAEATALQIEGPPFDSSAAYSWDGDATDGQGTVRQVISPTASAAAFHDPAAGQAKVSTVRLSKATVSKALAKLKHHSSKRKHHSSKRHHKRAHHARHH